MPGAPITAIGTQGGVGLASASGQGVSGPGIAAGIAETRSFARRADQVPSARRFIRETLTDHPGCTDAELLACELVTNAVQHAADAAEITVVVIREGQYVHVDVIDDGHVGLPHWREADGHDESGRGFQLVNEIAHRWGFQREPSGTCVWFELVECLSL